MCVNIQQKCANKKKNSKNELFKLQISLLLILYVDAHNNLQTNFLQNLMGYDFKF
jgi:hypothetical protein